MYEFMSISDNKSKRANSDYSQTRSIINYALYIDMPKNIKIPNGTNSSECLKIIFDEVYKVCEEYIPDFSYMGGSPYNTEEERDALREAIKNHCIISALYTSKVLCAEKYYNYKISMVDILEHCRNMGFFSLIECKNMVSNIDNWGKKQKGFKAQYPISREDKGYFDYGSQYDNSGSLRTIASRYRKKGGEYEKYFSHHILKDSRVGKNRKGEVQASSFNSDIFYELIRNGGNADRAILKLLEEDINKQNIDNTYLNKMDLDGIIGSLYKDMSTSRNYNINSGSKKNIDDILFDYQIERYYNHDLIKSISREFNDKELLWYLERYPVMLEILSYAQMLPNTMSRMFIVKKGLDILKQEKTLMKDKWGIIVDENMVSFGRVDQIDIKIMRWLEYFKKYCIFASYIAFPVLEKTFFILLYENISSGKYRSKLENIMNILASYVEANSKNIREDYCEVLDKRERGKSKIDVNVERRYSKKEIYYRLAYHMYKREDLGELYSRSFTKEYFSLIKDSERKAFRSNYFRSKRIELVEAVSKKSFIEVRVNVDDEKES